MKKYSKTSIVATLFAVIMLSGCGYENLSTNIFNQKHQEYLFVKDLDKTTFTPEEQRIIDKAEYRFSSYVVFDENNKISINGKTAKDMNMDQRLFDRFKSCIEYWNQGDYKMRVPIMSSFPMVRSAGEEGDWNTGTRGDNVMDDVIASLAYHTLDSLGYDTAAKLFDMWYFKNRTSAYNMNSSEWAEASGYASDNVNYSSGFQVYIEGTEYYSTSVTYSNDRDLYYSYGTATVFFDDDGNPIGFKDFYDFNPSDRSIFAETVVALMNRIGGDGGFYIHYGIHN